MTEEETNVDDNFKDLPPAVEDTTARPSDDFDSEEPSDEEPSEQDDVSRKVSHITRTDLSPLWRYGMLLYIFATLALLLASDIGSGIQAITITVPAVSDVWSKSKEVIVADESIFSSVRHLWDSGSYALAIFIGITSIAWPYVKLLLTIFAWVAPFPPRSNAKGVNRRERLIEILDLLGKWSFADVLVFAQILVAFRATVPVGAGTTLEVYILALWGFYGFVAATILGLVGTHIILYHHRQYLYHNKGDNGSDEDASDAPQQQSTPKGALHWTGMEPRKRWGLTALFVMAMTAYIVGCSLPIFEVSRQRGEIETTYVEFSIITAGAEYVELTKNMTGGDRWIQILWFLLTLVMPIVSTVLICCVLVLPMKKSRRRREQLYFATEIAYCWSCGEVTVLSTLFAVLQIPDFGNGLVDSGCSVCYAIGSTLLLPAFLPLAVGALLHMVLSLWLFQKLHRALYHPAKVPPVESTKVPPVENLSATFPSTDV